MANKLKNVFTNEKVSFGGKISFTDIESYDEFLEALELVQSEGKSVKVDGITSVKAMVQDGDSVYPFMEHRGLSDCIVGPSMEEVSFELDTDFGKKNFALNRYNTNQGIVLETSKNASVYIKLIFNKDVEKCKITYRAQPKLANSIRVLVDSFNLAAALFIRVFGQNNDNKNNVCFVGESTLVNNPISYFVEMSFFYQKIYAIEQELKIVFDPKELIYDNENLVVMEELNLLLNKKIILRRNDKILDMVATGIQSYKPSDNLKIGSVLAITFIGTTEYNLWGQDITLYTANLLSNAIVKVIKEIQNDELKILYDDVDSRPMYISYRGFQTEEEAEEEMKNIMENKNMYVEALTLGEIIQKGEL